MLRFLRNTALALAGAALILAGCAAPAAPKRNADVPPPNPIPAEPNDGTPVWARTVDAGELRATFEGTATDQEGNVYAVGYLFGVGTYHFGNDVEATTSVDTPNMFLVKYNAEGTAQWAKTAVSNPRNSWYKAVTTDVYGNVYAAGYFYDGGTFDFGDGITLTPTSSREGVLVKYDASGKVLWARKLPGVEDNVSDRVFSAVKADATSVTVAGYADLYPMVARYTAAGTLEWEKTLTSMPGDTLEGGKFLGVVTDGLGNTFAAGYYYSQSASGQLPLLAGFDSAGTVAWEKSVSVTKTALYSQFNAVALVSGSLYAAGYVQDGSGEGTAVSFGSEGDVEAPASANWQSVLVKYDTSGSVQWVQAPHTAGPLSSDSAFATVTTDGVGNVYVGGYLSDLDKDYDFGNGVTFTSGNTGARFLFARYDSTGAAQWVRTPAGSYFDLRSMAIAPSGAVSFAGILNGGSITFGTDITATNAAYENGLLVQYQ